MRRIADWSYGKVYCLRFVYLSPNDKKKTSHISWKEDCIGLRLSKITRLDKRLMVGMVSLGSSRLKKMLRKLAKQYIERNCIYSKNVEITFWVAQMNKSDFTN